MRHPRAWLLLAVLLPLVAVRGVFTTTRLFFVRDLAGYFWPHHLWLRRMLWSGQSPLWDPAPGLGYAAAADPAVQVFFLPTLPFRMLLPAIVGFNVSVALPFPLAALGMFVFLRKTLSPPAACLGGLAYALSGPILSTGNCTNLAWCSALVPWTLLSVDKLADGRTRWFSALAALLACSLLSGEPVTWAGTAALAVAYAAIAADGTRSLRDRLRLVTKVALGAAAALGLAAIQLLPLLDVTRRSIRGAEWLAGSWSFSAVRLFETLSPGIFGNYLGTPREIGPWLTTVNDGREPYLISLYLGVALVLLATQGLMAGEARKAIRFWALAGTAALLWGLGTHTPFYPALLDLAPALRTLRYPVKFVVFAAFAVAVLAAHGWESLGKAGRRRAAALAIGAVVVAAAAATLALAVLSPEQARALAQRAAAATDVHDPVAAAAFLMKEAASQATRLLALAAVAVGCLWVAGTNRQEAPLARWALLVLVVADLLGANAHLNPTISAEALREPEWIAATRAHRDDRVFITQNFLASQAPDVDLPQWGLPADRALVEVLAARYAALPPFPTAWGVREALSQELTGLRPREYLDLVERYQNSDRASRTRALRRLGTRYHILPAPPSPEAKRLEAVDGFPPLAVFEDPNPFPRAWVVERSRVEPDAGAAIGRIFDADFDPAQEVLVDREVAPAGRGEESANDETRATLTSEANTRVEVEALVPAPGGWLVLSDAFDPNWRVHVDGQEAPLLRANGLLRAVRLGGGSHRVVFAYRPRPFTLGAGVSLLAALVLLALAVRRSTPLLQYGP